MKNKKLNKKDVKVKEPLLPNQKKTIQVLMILVGFMIVLGFSLSIMSWFDII